MKPSPTYSAFVLLSCLFLMSVLSRGIDASPTAPPQCQAGKFYDPNVFTYHSCSICGTKEGAAFASSCKECCVAPTTTPAHTPTTPPFSQSLDDTNTPSTRVTANVIPQTTLPVSTQGQGNSVTVYAVTGVVTASIFVAMVAVIVFLVKRSRSQQSPGSRKRPVTPQPCTDAAVASPVYTTFQGPVHAYKMNYQSNLSSTQPEPLDQQQRVVELG